MASKRLVRTPHVSKSLAKEQTGSEAQRKAYAQQLREQGHYDKITELNAANSPLLRLPAEIRNMIFEQVFVNRDIHLQAYSEDPISIPDIYTFYDMGDFGLSLLFVSRQLRTETALLPYKLCTMRLIDGWWTEGEDNSRPIVRCFLKRRLREQVEVISDLALPVFDEQDGEHKLLRGTGSYWVEWLNSEEDGQWLDEVLGFKK